MAALSHGPRRLASELIHSRLFPDQPARRILGRYHLRRVLGRGGSGIVFAAFDTELEREVAIKALDGDASARAPQEARLLARLRHPNVISIYDVVGEDDCVFVVMEMVRGKALSQWLEEPQSPLQVLEMFERVGQGLLAAHDRGIVHRDFKPQNVLVGVDGNPQVVDFGLAAHIAPKAWGTEAASSPQRADVVVAGTPGYMAPEQWLGQEADERTDQFAFCVSLLQALFARPVLRSSSGAELTRALANLRALPPSEWPFGAALREPLLRGLSVTKELRYPSMRALLRDLSRARAALPAKLPVVTDEGPAELSSRVHLLASPRVFVWTPNPDLDAAQVRQDAAACVAVLRERGPMHLLFRLHQLASLSPELCDIWSRTLERASELVTGLSVIRRGDVGRLGLNALALSLKWEITYVDG